MIKKITDSVSVKGKKQGARSITLSDVASYADVSTATVSRVLNSPEKVTDASRNHIQAAIL